MKSKLKFVKVTLESMHKIPEYNLQQVPAAFMILENSVVNLEVESYVEKNKANDNTNKLHYNV